MNKRPIARPPPEPEPEPTRRGRPLGSTRVTEPHAAVGCWLPASYHDRLIELAKQEEKSISATVRALLILRLDK